MTGWAAVRMPWFMAAAAPRCAARSTRTRSGFGPRSQRSAAIRPCCHRRRRSPRMDGRPPRARMAVSASPSHRSPLWTGTTKLTPVCVIGVPPGRGSLDTPLRACAATRSGWKRFDASAPACAAAARHRGRLSRIFPTAAASSAGFPGDEQAAADLADDLAAATVVRHDDGRACLEGLERDQAEHLAVRRVDDHVGVPRAPRSARGR